METFTTFWASVLDNHEVILTNICWILAIGLSRLMKTDESEYYKGYVFATQLIHAKDLLTVQQDVDWDEEFAEPKSFDTGMIDAIKDYEKGKLNGQ